MRADEIYAADYQVLMLSETLKRLQRDGKHDEFCVLMLGMWRKTLKLIPEENHAVIYVMALDAYFTCKGDMAKATATFDEYLAKAVGETAHRDAMKHVDAKMARIKEFTDVLLSTAAEKRR